MFGDVWDVHASRMAIQRNFEPGPLIPHADLIGNYRSGMMDWRESESHQNYLKQQDAAFNSPTGLNSHREMYFGEPVTTPNRLSAREERMRFYQEKLQREADAIRETTRRAEEIQRRVSEEFSRRCLQPTEPKLIMNLSSPTQSVKNPKSPWSPTIDYGNGLWEKRNEGRDETLIGYKPYGTHTHIGPGFISMKDEETGRHLRWDTIVTPL